MKLESARELKAKLVEGLVTPFIERAAATGGLAMAARALPAAPTVQRSIAIGVAPPRAGEFQLAVRVQRQGLMSSPVVERITRQARGEVDVRFVGRIDKRALPWHRKPVRPLVPGGSCGHIEITSGTIGAFCTRGGKIYILSNNHVLANEDFGKVGDRIVQPGPSDGGVQPDDRIARLRHWVRFRKSKPNFLDCALAEVDEGVDFDPVKLRGLVKGKDRKLKGLGPDVVDAGDVVYKLGRMTGATKGRVSAFDVDNVVVNYDTANLRFDNQIEIEGIGTKPFSDGGDSGSIIVNARMEVVGLLFCGAETGGSDGLGLTYANPIHDVLKALKSKLLV
jgi:S1-C subfamily serine protease